MILRFLLSLFLLFMAGESYAQKKTADIIPKEEARKVEHAKKLYNQLKIFDGEKILKELVRQHPNECYYHEALIQMQRQVLVYVVAAQGELQTMQANHLINGIDSSELEIDKDTLEAGTPFNKKVEVDEEDKNNDLSWNGLDRGKSKKVEEKKDLDKEIVLTEAVVTIDSSLLKPELDENGDTIKSKKLTKEEREYKKKMKAVNDLAQIPYEGYKNDFINNARKSTLYLDCLDSASYYLRMYAVDTLDIDNGASDEALEAYENGISFMYEKNYIAASKQFEKAIVLFPEYFKARLKLSDIYFFMNKDSTALKQIRAVIEDYPSRPEPFEKLADHFYETGKYMEAAAAIIDAISIYPQQDYTSYLKRIVLKTGKDFNTQWIKREVFPLTTAHVYEDIIAQEKTPWWHYQAAKQDVYSYFDTLGMVRPNEKTNERYLEVYGWKKMLNNSSRENFLFARVMDKIGYLDCYVLITLFHQDIYGQFIDFTKNNKEKIRKYFYLVMNWENKKFDKLREQIAPPKKNEEKKK